MLQIINYAPELQPYFEKFNTAWLEEYFSVEPIDKYVLQNPDEAILKNGGEIFFVENDGQVIGTAALRFHAPGLVELTKMAVDKKYQGLGAGKLLCQTAIEKAKTLGAKKLILYSTTSLETAIAIYYKLGFKAVPLEDGLYKRANIKMEINFSNMKITNEFVSQFAKEWIDAWNSHDTEKILSHYEEGVQYHSPIIAHMSINGTGFLSGKESVKDYFEKALKLYPDLHFELIQALAGTNSIIIYYKSINNKKCAECMDIGEDGKITGIKSHYDVV